MNVQSSPAVGLARGGFLRTLFSTPALLLCLLSPPSGWTADFLWVNGGAAGNYTNPSSWSPASVPGAGDTAVIVVANDPTLNFTADASISDVIFNQTNRTSTLNISNQVWFVTNSVLLASSAGSTSTVFHRSGTLVVTNADGTGSFVVGQTGKAAFSLAGGTMIVDHLTATNNTGGSHAIGLNWGSLTVLNGSSIKNNAVSIGNTANQTMYVTYQGGTNGIVVDGAGNNTSIGGGDVGRFGVLTATGPGTFVSNSASSLIIGNFATGTLIISNGATFHNANQSGGQGNMIMGNANAGASGSSVIVTGNNSLLTNVGALTVGQVGSNMQFIVSDGGRAYVNLISAGGTGTTNNLIKVEGPNSLFVLNNSGNQNSIGRSGHADVVLTNGGQMKLEGASAQMLFIGEFAAGYGTITITGDDSLLSYKNLIKVGDDAGAVTAGRGLIVVTDGGTLEMTAGIETGVSGKGVVSNKGGIYQFTSAGSGIITNTANSITLEDGTISWKGIANADIANAQVAKITMTGNNTFRLVTATNNNVASYTFQTNTAPLYAHLVLDNGRFQATTLTIGDGGSIAGHGVVNSANVTNHGTIAPGFSPGQLTFTGNLVLDSTSLLDMEIGGLSSSLYDQIVVLGDLTLTGALSLTMLNGYSPTPGDTFVLIDNQGANLISGEFNGLTNNQFIDASQNGIDAFFRIQYNVGTGNNDLVLLAVIPEPSTMGFAAVSAALALLWRSRRQSP